jgi:putative transposase
MHHRDKMTYDPAKHHRRSIRLRGYDYRQAGAYFVTLVAQQRECLFGHVVGGRMHVNEVGQVVAVEWTRSAEIRREIESDLFVVMPNHLHGVVIIRDNAGVGAHGRAPLQINEPQTPYRPPRSLGSFVAGFKSAVTRRINQIRGTPGLPIWQRNYYEHLVRHERELDAVRRYIEENPLRWDKDPENPAVAQAVGDHRGLPLHPNGDPV